MNHHYQKLKPFIQNFTDENGFIYKELGSEEIVGVILSASSYIRKPYTINRILNLINKLQLPLTVSEEGFQMDNRFKIN